MEDPEIDRILSQHDEILPSSGFVSSVMDAVRREAAVPPPIPFPWKFAVPCLVLAALAVATVFGASVAAVTQGVKGSFPPPTAISWPSPPMLTSVAQGNIAIAVGWSCLALLVAFIAVKLSLRLVAGRV